MFFKHQSFTTLKSNSMTIEEIIELVKENPNDMELGRKIRNYVNQHLDKEA
jgi:hypothetical protein